MQSAVGRSQTSAQPARVPRWTPLALVTLALFAAIVVATSVGSVAVPPAETLRALWHGVTGTLSGPTDVIIWQLRLPRVLTAALVGAALSLAGVAYQGLFRNPLADPYLLGVASGAGFGATLALVFGASVPLLAWLGVPLTAFIAALLAVLLVYALARQRRGVPLVSLILAGVVVGSSLSALTSFVMLASREQAAGVLAWLLGSFAFSSWSKLASVLPFVLVTAVVVQASAQALNLLQLGETQAAQLGLSTEAFKLVLLSVATLATAAAVSVSGIIGFVGLMVPHAVRLALGPDHRRLVPTAAVLGALFLVLADLLARTVIAPGEIPIGVVTALVGGPFFLYLLRRQKGRAA
ncbi:iron ABC transporter permease [soil metagenome]